MFDCWAVRGSCPTCLKFHHIESVHVCTNSASRDAWSRRANLTCRCAHQSRSPHVWPAAPGAPYGGSLIGHKTAKRKKPCFSRFNQCPSHKPSPSMVVKGEPKTGDGAGKASVWKISKASCCPLSIYNSGCILHTSSLCLYLFKRNPSGRSDQWPIEQ